MPEGDWQLPVDVTLLLLVVEISTEQSGAGGGTQPGIAPDRAQRCTTRRADRAAAEAARGGRLSAGGQDHSADHDEGQGSVSHGLRSSSLGHEQGHLWASPRTAPLTGGSFIYLVFCWREAAQLTKAAMASSRVAV